jgi:hypothetical protein
VVSELCLVRFTSNEKTGVNPADVTALDAVFCADDVSVISSQFESFQPLILLKSDADDCTVTLLSKTDILLITEVFVLDAGIVAVEVDPLLPLIVILTGVVEPLVTVIVSCCGVLMPAGLVAVTLKV